jgi:hypothetical protein
MKSLAVVCAMLFVVFSPVASMAVPPDEVIIACSDHLAASQNLFGTWDDEEDFTGSIVAGLVRAYEETGDTDYIASAKLGVAYILDVAGGNFFGDEAYALARFTEVTGEQSLADIVLEFYDGLDTAAYISGFNETDLSNAVFYVAHHAVAAYKVGAADAGMWRTALIEYLSLIDDDLAYYPVMSLGVATWALAQTGAMDDTTINPDGTSENYLVDVKLSDLPDILSIHQAISGPYAGSFYYRFDHTPAGPVFEVGGYTEDTVFGLLGLIAVNGTVAVDGVVRDFGQEIQDARKVLAVGIPASGIVYGHIWSHIPTITTETRYTYAGEVLEAMQSKVDIDFEVEFPMTENK